VVGVRRGETLKLRSGETLEPRHALSRIHIYLSTAGGALTNQGNFCARLRLENLRSHAMNERVPRPRRVIRPSTRRWIRIKSNNLLALVKADAEVLKDIQPSEQMKTDSKVTGKAHSRFDAVRPD